MSAKAYDKAKTIDKYMYKQLWQDLKELISKEYDVKVEKENELFIRIKGEKTADIEVFPTNDYIHVQLWYYDLPKHLAKRHEKNYFYTATEVINEINSIEYSIKQARKYYDLPSEDKEIFKKMTSF